MCIDGQGFKLLIRGYEDHTLQSTGFGQAIHDLGVDGCVIF